jgi:hypothetical protein
MQDFLQFSMTIFDTNGRIKPPIHQIKSQKGTGVWGREINNGTIAYIEEIRVHPKYQRQGVGRWAIEKLLTSDTLAVCTPRDFSSLEKHSNIPQSTAPFSFSGLPSSMTVHLSQDLIPISTPRSRVLLRSGVLLGSVVLVGPVFSVMLVTQTTR